MDPPDKGMLHILGGAEWGRESYSEQNAILFLCLVFGARDGVQFETPESFISGIFHSVILDFVDLG